VQSEETCHLSGCSWGGSRIRRCRQHRARYQVLRWTLEVAAIVGRSADLTRWLDLPDVAAIAIPAHLLVINGRQDGLFTVDGMEEAHRKLAASYKKAGVPTHFRARMYDTPHQFNREMQAEAWEWLRQAFRG
jgi:hypothetical protein